MTGWETSGSASRGGATPGGAGTSTPRGLRHRDELAYAAARLGTIEVNGTFYSLQTPSSYAAWRDAVPADCVLAIKGGRFVTHMKRLRDAETPLANFFASGVLALGDKLGPVLWQLPETLAFDAERVSAFCRLLPRTIQQMAALAGRHDDKVSVDRSLTERVGRARHPVRHVVEFRHRSFCAPESLAVLREHDVGVVVAQSAGRWLEADVVTSDVVYVRLHGDTALYTSGYTPVALDRWAERCREWARQADVYVYLDNDAAGRAPWDAIALQERLA